MIGFHGVVYPPGPRTRERRAFHYSQLWFTRAFMRQPPPFWSVKRQDGHTFVALRTKARTFRWRITRFDARRNLDVGEWP